MPNSIISNKPTIYQFGSHIQYLVAESAASTAFVCCRATFATKAHLIHHCNQCSCEEKHIYQEAIEERTKLGAHFGFLYFLLFPFFHDFLSVFILGHKIFQWFWCAEQFGVKLKFFYRNW